MGPLGFAKGVEIFAALDVVAEVDVVVFVAAGGGIEDGTALRFHIELL